MSEIDPGYQPTQDPSLWRRVSDRIHWPASLATTAVATLAVSVYVHGEKHAEGSVVDGVHDFLTIEDSYTYEQEVDRSFRTKTGREIIATPIKSAKGKSRYELSSGAQVWAERFEEDPHAGEFVDPQEIDKVLDGIKKLARDGADILAIEVTGFASAEDDGEGGGLTKPSQKNEALAEHRAAVTRRALRRLIGQEKSLDEATKGTAFKAKDSVEQKLTEKEAAQTERRAKRSGFDSAEQMIEAWNRDPLTVKKSDRRYLNKLLGSERKVAVNILWKKDGANIVREETFCTTFNITNIKTREEKDHEDWPIPLLIPVLIPRVKLPKRTPKTPTPDEVPITEVPVRPEYVSAARSEAYIRSARRMRWAGRLIGVPVVAFLAAVNVSGENCKGNDHLPRPWPIDFVWQALDHGAGRGADVKHEWSLGIPFVKEAQLKLDEGVGNQWGILDPEKPCAKPVAGPPAPLPECTIINITQQNGREISRVTAFEAITPIKSRTVRTDK